MAAVAHGWKPPASSGISLPVSVAKEFNAADEARGALEKVQREAERKKRGR